MDKSLINLTDAVKKILNQLKPHQHPVSFILLIGKTGQGKTALLRQSKFNHQTITAECSADIFYNANGIILELNESWLIDQKTLLQHTLKELNRCHRTVRISGLILAIDASALCMLDPALMIEALKAHAHLLQRFGHALGHRIDSSIMLTKLDGLAGFSDFFQQEHVTDLSKPFGFSLDWGLLSGKLTHNYRLRFEQFIHSLEQQVIHKMHPARSSLKRTLIREFPLQLSNLRITIHSLLQLIPPQSCRVQTIYFTSAEQGGFSVDHLNKKIQHEYALAVPDQFPQSTNYRAYFIEGALLAFQTQTQRHAPHIGRTQQWQAYALASALGLSLAWIAHHYVASMRQLDDASKALIAYDAESTREDLKTNSLIHLSEASRLINTLPPNIPSSKAIEHLKETLQETTSAQLTHDFLPIVLSTIEQALRSTQEPPAARYDALKIYLMLSDPKKRDQSEIVGWFKQHWLLNTTPEKTKNLIALLVQVLNNPKQAIPINQQLIRDARNYLNALPMSYLYYAMTKQRFPSNVEPIQFEGFALAKQEIPIYFTKKEYRHILSMIPGIATKLETENWILTRQDLSNLPARLEEAYNYDYVLWWKNMMQKTTLAHVQTYEEAHQLTHSLEKANSMNQFISWLQAQTGPDFNEQDSAFNRSIASQFSSLNLISPSALRDLSRTIRELQPFLMTLSVVNDQGRSAFSLSKSRFQAEGLNNPFTTLSAKAAQFPEPIASWAKQLADDTWFLLMNDAKQYINTEWQHNVFQQYQQAIANRYPFDSSQSNDVSITDFDRFFSPNGTLATFVDQYLKPFLDTTHSEWTLKETDGYVLPLSQELLSELMRANVITAMFFPAHRNNSYIEFSLQKLNLDPIVSQLKLTLGNTTLTDTQHSESFTHFQWPESNATLLLASIEGNHYELNEHGEWAFFKMLQKVNVLADEQDSSSLQILFEINGNAGRYVLKTQNQINPFTPGILNGFNLTESIATT